MPPRLIWAALVCGAWILGEAVWWSFMGYWAADTSEAFTVATALIIAVTTCPDRANNKEGHDG